MPKMIAIKAQTYGTRTLKADEEFDVDDQYVATLVSLGRARLVETKSTKTKPTTSKSAEPEAEEEGKTYKTRSLKADDT